MLVAGKTAVIFGGSGSIGAAVAQTLSREGAQVFIGARNPARLGKVAEDIRAAGYKVETFLVDVLDERTTIDAVTTLAERTGGIDIAMNATGFLHDQGTGISDLSVGAFMRPIETFLRALFVTSKAVAPHMGKNRPGVIITITAPAGRMAIPGHLGHIVTCAGEEAFTRVLASELGPKNIRVVCVKTHAVADTARAGSYTAELFMPKASAMGLEIEEWLEGAAQSTMLGRLPTLSQVAQTAAFLASDHAAAMTATVVNLTAGAALD
jgi:NAD(P)-dependent dehydrogenase (short-subunit alcohol dehydrogenase family)